MRTTRWFAALSLASLSACGGNDDASSGQAGHDGPPTIEVFPAATSYTTTIAGTNDPADIYAPADKYRPAKLKPPFPPVVLLQGTNVDKQSYSELAAAVARYGFIVIVPNHAREVAGFGKGLFAEPAVVTQAFEHLKAEGKRSGAPIFGLVDGSRLGVMGHSLGGAAGLYAIDGRCIPLLACSTPYTRPPELKAGAFIGTNNVQGSMAVDVDTKAAATALVQGSLDGKALPAQAAATYALLEPPRALITIEGANHYGLTNTGAPPGASADPMKPTLPQDQSVARHARWSALFLRAYVAGDDDARWYITQSHGEPDKSVTIEEDDGGAAR